MGHNQTQPRVLSRKQLVDIVLQKRQKAASNLDELPESITKLTIQYVSGEIDSIFIESTLKCL